MKNIVLACIAAVVVVAPAGAQSDRGRLIGTIYDPSGAVVPNASVSITNQATHAARQAAADDKGNYRFDDLLPAPYQVVATAAGFAQAVNAEVVLAAGQERVLHFRLQPS